MGLLQYQYPYYGRVQVSGLPLGRSMYNAVTTRVEKRFSYRRISVAPYIDYFNITNHDSVVQPNYEFYQRTPQFLSENQRFPIFGLRVEF